jgi:Spy/CpxP family protein refolding chaperone
MKTVQLCGANCWYLNKRIIIQINDDMKNTGKIAGILLMLFIAGSLSLSAQRGMRRMRPDSAEMNWMKMKQWQMPLMMQNPDSLKMGGMRHGMVPGRMNNMDRFMGPGWQVWQSPRGMRHMGMGPRMGMMGPGMGMRQQGPGRIMENIPNLTDKQKKDIADLRQKQQVEMQKFREEMQGKMKEMRESHRTKVINLLTPEQKKWLEENTPKPLNK